MIDTNTAVSAPTTALRDLGLRESAADPNANDLDKDAFLQLLVAQLRYQDPLNPNDPSEFMATTAQFTTIEKLDELTQQGANNAIISGLSMASSLVGRTITYVGSDDAIATGVVSSAKVSGGEVRLVTDSGTVDLSTVIGIGETEAAATAPVATPTATTATPVVTTDDTEALARVANPAEPLVTAETAVATEAAVPIAISSVPPTAVAAPPQEDPLIAGLATDNTEPKEPTS